ncbi:MAG: hypothetical protein KIT09_25280 [Bryobacteraceae bacterium]|nr:hypothetical protein [Bryobacteraceae bacterium]
MTRRDFGAILSICGAPASLAGPHRDDPVAIGSRRELFVDRELIAEMRGAELRLGAPINAGAVLRLDMPWEGAFSGYATVLRDRDRYRMYYRGAPAVGQDGNEGEITCCAESADGIEWRRPELELFTVQGKRPNNVVLAQQPPYSHNFTPFIDTRPGTPESQRYKAIAGVHKSGLAGFVSPDGIRWRLIRDEPILPPRKEFSFDSQNLAFWSSHESKYLLYYRTWKKIGAANYRWVSRAVSDDFLHWTIDGEMSYGDAKPEHLYTNQTSPYFRAPHIYTAICARFMPDRQVLTDDQAKAIGVDPRYFKDCSDAVLVTSRGGRAFTRTYMEAFLRPGVGLENWVSRSNYPALNLVQTGPAAMSLYVNRNYGQPTAYVCRYELRLDGFASAHAGYVGGELVTRPLTMDGSRLELNYATSAAGGVRVEIQDPSGQPHPGCSLADAPDLIGDEIDRVYAWKSGPDVSALSGQSLRLRFVLKDADLYSFRFRA